MIEQHAPKNDIEQMIREHKLRTYEAYSNSPRYTARSTTLSGIGESSGENQA